MNARQVLMDRERLAVREQAARRLGLASVAWGLEGDCGYCDGPLPPQMHQGNPRRWCSEACRVAAYRARTRTESAGAVA